MLTVLFGGSLPLSHHAARYYEHFRNIYQCLGWRKYSYKHHLVEILLRLQDVLFHLVGILLQLLNQSGQIGPAVKNKVVKFPRYKTLYMCETCVVLRSQTLCFLRTR